MGTSLPSDIQPVAQPLPAPPDPRAAQAVPAVPRTSDLGDTPFVEEGRLQRAVAGYLSPDEGEYLTRVLDYAHTLRASAATAVLARSTAASGGDGGELEDASTTRGRTPRTQWDFAYAILVAQTLAESVHVDAESLAAVLLYQVVELGLATPDEIGAALGGMLGMGTAQLIQSIERFDALQRPAAARRRAAGRKDTSTDTGAAGRAAGRADGAAHPAERDTPPHSRRRERQRKDEDEAIRKMFVGMAEDPRVVIFKIAGQLITMRAMREAADLLRQRAGTPDSHSALVRDEPGAELAVEDSSAAALDAAAAGAGTRDRMAPDADGVDTTLPAQPAPDLAPTPRWTLEECLVAARETRTLYAPLAGRLGLGRLESELEDLAFAVLEPEAYRWLSEAVADEKHQRASYVARVCDILRDELAKIGLRADVSGRVKHLYSIYRKVQRTGSHDITQLYDIIAFRIITESITDCYVALGHVHQLWRPTDGRIKDFIATPKPNGYRSLHTTVFCLDERLAEIQIRTRDQHQLAEYGMAMHWHYKEMGDTASAAASDLQGWVKQVLEWQQELRHAPTEAAAPPLLDGREMPGEQIYVFTPAGDPKELPALSTPLDFAYRIHSNIGDHTAGARVTTDEGRLVTRMVPLDYELHNGDTVEIITHKNAHPTRDWLRFARTKAARTHIQRYVKAHERQIDQQIGRDRLDRELKLQGARGGLEDVREDDLLWVARELKQESVENLLVALGTEKLRPAAVIAALRERIPERLAPPPDPREAQVAAAEAPARAPEPAPPGGVDVAGVGGLFTRLASCCNPVPGDDVRGFITRGRGVVVHRADCPNLAALLSREPEREVTVELSHLEGQQTYRVPIVVQATDRPGLLADVTGVISRLKINMARVTTATNPNRHTATITAMLELSQADQLESVFAHILGVKSVHEVERKQARSSKPADKLAAAAGPGGKRPNKGGAKGRR